MNEEAPTVWPDTKTQSSDEIAVEKFLCTFILPDDKKVQVVRYITELSLKYPSMNTDRKIRKAVEYFKLKKISSILPVNK